MIQFKSFDITDTDGVNKFVKKNPPINTKDGSGTLFRDNHIVVVYEDGTFNDKEAWFSQTNFAINQEKTDVIAKKIVGQRANLELDRLIPKSEYETKDGSVKGLNDIANYFQKKMGISYKQGCEMGETVIKLHHEKWTSEAEIKRKEEVVIPALEALLEAHQ